MKRSDPADCEPDASHLDDEWEEPSRLQLVSRRSILQRHCLPDLRQLVTDCWDVQEPHSPEPLVSQCECCDGQFRADCDTEGDKMPTFPAPSGGEAVRRRNSTYLALACANAVSQGSMTRKVRQMFESPASGAAPSSGASSGQRAPRRSDIAQAVQARRQAAVARRSSSLNPLIQESDKEPVTNVICINLHKFA
jgi:hypothetical protein